MGQVDSVKEEEDEAGKGLNERQQIKSSEHFAPFPLVIPFFHEHGGF